VASPVVVHRTALGSGPTSAEHLLAGAGAAKEIEAYRFNNHEGGQEHHWVRQLLFLRRILG
jgi:cephalosporin-C deacetylase